MVSKSILVGITGGIGSGKSTVCRIFQSIGVPVYDADTRARWLMNNDELLIKEIESEFGEESYNNGFLNREYLGRLVFPNPEKLAKLNSLTHPAVARDFEKWVNEHRSSPYLIKEAALLIESGSYKQLDKLILVTAPEEVRIKRVLQRDSHRTESDVRTLMQRQMPEEEKKKYCDFVIDNDGIKPVLALILSFF